TEAVPVLLKLLRNDPRIRVKNGAALGLRDLSANQAVPVLIQLIENKTYRRTRGTFVYSLQTLDWYSQYFYAVARLLIDENYEVREMAFMALQEAAQKMTRDQKEIMRTALMLSVLGSRSRS